MTTPTGVQISQLPSALVLSGAELLPLVTLGHISAITQAATAVITLDDTTSVNPFTAGDQVYITGVGGMTQINGQGVVVSSVGGSSGAWTLTVPINSSGFGAYTSGGEVTKTVNHPLDQLILSAGLYNATFDSGNVQFAGPDGLLAGVDSLIFGTNIPNPSGTPGNCLLLASGGGLGINTFGWFITDQAFDVGTPGNDIGHTAGEVQPDSTQRGGNWSSIAGAADLGTGGQWLGKGGTAARGVPGLTVLQGADNTDLSHPAGDTFVIAGETGSTGANLHVIMTETGGVAGVLHHKVNSTNLWDEVFDGSWFFYANSSLPGGGYGAAMSPLISAGAGQPVGWATSAEVASGTVSLAKLTSGGAAGSITVVNGLITAFTNPT